MSSCVSIRTSPCERCGRIWEHGPYTILCPACHKAVVERKKENRHA